MSRKLGRLLATTALALAGCGFGGGSDVTYYEIASSSDGTAQGSNCPAAGNTVTTYSDIFGAGTVALYTLPGSNSYLLDLGSGEGLNGSLASGTYTFTGQQQTVDKSGNPTVTTTETITVTLTPQGSGVTGAVNVTDNCNSSGSTGCDGAQDQSSYNCVSSGTFTGTTIPSPTQVSVDETTSPSAPSGT